MRNSEIIQKRLTEVENSYNKGVAEYAELKGREGSLQVSLNNDAGGIRELRNALAYFIQKEGEEDLAVAAAERDRAIEAARIRNEKERADFDKKVARQKAKTAKAPKKVATSLPKKRNKGVVIANKVVPKGTTVTVQDNKLTVKKA